MGRIKAIKRARHANNAVGRELRRAGVFARLEAVQKAMSAPDFGPRFRARITGAEADMQIKGVPELQEVLYRFLREDMGLDTDGVQIFIDWQPDLGRKLSFGFAPTFEATQRAKDVVAGKLATA
jgi:hypothetical protein